MDYSELRDLMPLYLENLQSASRKIESIVTGLRDFAGQEAHKIQQSIDLNEVAKAAASASEGLIRHSTRRFSLDLHDGPLRVSGNFPRLQQVVESLIQTACSAVENASDPIVLRTSREGQWNCLSVEDSGKVDSEGPVSRIGFSAASQESGGGRLGLAIANAIVDEHRGTMRCFALPVCGTKVEVFLPRSEDPHR
jgi:signal transduction histidine kinase